MTVGKAWNRPDGVDVYLGLILFHDGKVLLRHLEQYGYVWTFPRALVVEKPRLPEYALMWGFADELRVALDRIVAIPGTWRGGASFAHYWRGDVHAIVPRKGLDAADEARRAFGADPPPQWIQAVRRLDAAGLPVLECGKPLPLSDGDRELMLKMAAELPDPPEPAPPMQTSWVNVEDVAGHLGLSRTEPGRERDLNVWREALWLQGYSKPLVPDNGWRPIFSLANGKGRRTVRSDPFDTRSLPFPVRLLDKEDLALANEILGRARSEGYNVEACRTCRHVKWSGLSKYHGSGFCTASRTSDNEHRAELPDALGWCPRFEKSLIDG